MVLSKFIAGALFLVLFFVIYHLSFITSVSAHLAGQPPFFKINGVFSDLYPVPVSSSPNFLLPQDISIENYSVNQNLDFEIVKNFLPVPADIAEKTIFVWDFGDGQKGSGFTNSHRYTSPKSYILTITAQASTDPEPTLIQSVLINIVPSPDYKFPKSIIIVDGQRSADPLTDVLKANFSKEISLDGSKSEAGTGKIVSYLWDLGDTNDSDKPSLTRKYDDSLNQVFPVLRVTDQNGFFTDSFVQLNNDPDFVVKTRNDATKTLTEPFYLAQYWVYIVAFMVSLLAAFGVIKWMRSRNKNKKL